MKPKTAKTCKTCNACKSIYDRLLYSYGKCIAFYCTVREEVITRDNFCENWRKKKVECDLSPQRFAEVEEDLKFIINLLKDCNL